jgi:hypothetical protein
MRGWLLLIIVGSDGMHPPRLAPARSAVRRRTDNRRYNLTSCALFQIAATDPDQRRNGTVSTDL